MANKYKKQSTSMGTTELISTTVPDSIASAMMMMQVNTINAFKESNKESLNKQTIILNGMMQLASSILDYNKQLSEALETAFDEISKKDKQIERLVERVISIDTNGGVQTLEISVEDKKKKTGNSLINKLMGNTSNTNKKYIISSTNDKPKKYLSVEARKTPKEFTDLIDYLIEECGVDTYSVPELYKRIYSEFSELYNIDYDTLIKRVCKDNKLSTCSKSFAICNDEDIYKKFVKFINKKVKQCQRNM